jgi:murein DD-endopeptidase MepM/ murein hydrolase activator NlpD
MTAEEYVKQELTAGRLTYAHIVELVKFFQKDHTLLADGKPGTNTRQAIEAGMIKTLAGHPFLHAPLPTLAYGRKPYITSSFKPSDRPNHVGCDWFYAWEHGDLPDFVGDRGAAGKKADGTPKHVVPFGVNAVAAADGTVQVAGNSATGYRLWIDHGNGWRTGYFHLLDLKVHVGDVVKAGDRLGLVGDNPKDNDGRHLHFELSPVDKYAPVDPEPFLVK